MSSLNCYWLWNCYENLFIRSSHGGRGCAIKKVFIKISHNSQEKTCVWVSFFKKIAGLQACNFIIIETPTQVLYYKFCEIFKNTFFHRPPPVASSCFCKYWQLNVILRIWPMLSYKLITITWLSKPAACFENLKLNDLFSLEGSKW